MAPHPPSHTPPHSLSHTHSTIPPSSHIHTHPPPHTQQVFRTYNASITLDRLLFEMEEGGGVGHHGEPYCSRSLEAKKADYDRANKEVREGGGVFFVAEGGGEGKGGVGSGERPAALSAGFVCLLPCVPAWAPPLMMQPPTPCVWRDQHSQLEQDTTTNCPCPPPPQNNDSCPPLALVTQPFFMPPFSTSSSNKKPTGCHPV